MGTVIAIANQKGGVGKTLINRFRISYGTFYRTIAIS